MNRLRNRIDRQLIILTVAFSSLLTLFITIFHLVEEYHQERANTQRAVEEVRHLVPALADIVWKLDNSHIAVDLEALIHLTDIEFAGIVTADGKTSWSAGQRSTSRIIAKSYPLEYEQQGSTHVVGTLEVVASLDAAFQKVLSHALTILISNAGKTFLVVIFMYLVFRRLVTRRIEQLVTSIEQIGPQLVATGDTGLLVGAAGKRDPDEIDMLQAAFEKMVERIAADVTALKQAGQEIETLNRDLEHKVHNRTEQLVATNQSLHQAKQAADAAYASKSRFLAATSHDLRQPLQAIHLFVQAIENSGLNAQQQQIANMLAHSTRTLGDLLNTLLEISKLDLGRVAAYPETISVRELLDRISPGFALLAQEKGLGFRIHCPQKILTVNTDPRLIQRIIDNLIINAIKYTAEGGILLGIRQHGARVVFQVWDTGIGIAPDQVEKVFDEYFQAGNAERNPESGLGLGLAIVEKMAALLDTRVVCRSRFGSGSVFEFSLPLVAR